VLFRSSFVATGQNKQVQHLEGGIIRQLLVKEGDIVEASQPLLRLDDTAAQSKLRRLVTRQFRLLATAARLHAEINASDRLQLPLALVAEIRDPDVQSIVQAQEAELITRRRSLANQEEVLRKEIAALKESVRGYEAQVSANRERYALFDEELKAKSPLIEHQLIRKSEVIALQRSEVGLAGELGDLLGRSGDTTERIARAEQQISQLRLAAWLVLAPFSWRAPRLWLGDHRSDDWPAQFGHDIKIGCESRVRTLTASPSTADDEVAVPTRLFDERAAHEIAALQCSRNAREKLSATGRMIACQIPPYRVQPAIGRAGR
jgi:multidrug efflux pump subunit AcrA (membrane-fusion protein)